MNKTLLAAVAAGTLLLGANAASAAVQTYDFSVYNAAFTGNLGSVTVTDHGTSTLDFDVVLGSNVYFQLTNGSPHDAFWFDLPGLGGTHAVTYNITSPDGTDPGTGDYPTGGDFNGSGYSNNSYGQGWADQFDYAIRVSDSSNPNQYFGNGGHLTFSVTADSGATLSLASLGAGHVENVNGQNYNVVMGADLRQCLSQTCVTGPVGAIINSGGAVPEPATWGLMILGFGGIGSLLRRRRGQLALA
jgi:hypothetical protein